MIYRCLTRILLAPVMLGNELCDATQLKPGQTIYAKSAHYPSISLSSNKGACTTNKFWVDSDGDPVYSDSSFCGSRTVSRDSHSQDLALAYGSNRTHGGKFQCSLTST